MIDALDAMDEGEEDLLALVIAEFETNKARERRFSSRSEAGRYAAQVRWGNRGATGSGDKPPTGLVLEPTYDVAEAIATGRPYAPLLEENFPDDLKAMQAEVRKLDSAEIMSTTGERSEIVSRYKARLTEHYETVLADGLAQVRETKSPSVMVKKALENDPGFSRIMAKNMAGQQMARDAQGSYIRDKIGKERAMEFTAATIDGSPSKRITVSAYEDDALKILRDGRIKNQFETASSNGMMSVQTRASHEAIAYGVHPFANPQVRPVYGALHPHGVRHAEQNRSEQYGRVHFVLKDAVIDRSTASVEDSLGTVLQPNPARKAVQPQYSSRGLILRDSAGSPEEVAARHKAGRTSPYAEAQIHGGVKLGDIAYIAISEPPKASRELRAAARSRGLEIRVLPQGDGRLYGAEEFPALDDSAMEKSASLDMVGLLTDAIQKARERRFSSRSEAGRHAANVRWGTSRGMSAEGAETLLAQSQSQISAGATAEAKSVMSQLGEITDEELTVVYAYSTGGYMRINGVLRGQDMSADHAERGRAEAEVLQGLMDRAPALQRDIVVFRGIRSSERNAEAVAKIANAPVGSVIKDPAFLSTSHGRDTAAMFSGGVELRIVVPKGSKALPLHAIGSVAKGEREWLLPRNARLRVVKREVVDEPNATTRYPSNTGIVRLTVVVEAD